MLIFFKPWTQASDLKLSTDSWTHALNQFLDSDAVLYEHVDVINNMQFLHACHDHCDHTSSTHTMSLNSILSSSLDEDSSSIEMDLSGEVNENELLLLQNKHDALFQDVNQLAMANSSSILECLWALAQNGLTSDISSGSDIAVDAAKPISLPVNGATLRSEWKAIYAAWKKDLKSSLHTTNPALSAVIPSVSMTASLTFDDMDFVSMPTDVSSSLPPTAPPLQSSHKQLCKTICQEWTLNSDQQCAFLIVANHAAVHPE